MIRDVKFFVYNGAVDDAPKKFEIRVYVKFHLNPIILYFSTEDTLNQLIKNTLDFIQEILLVVER